MHSIPGAVVVAALSCIALFSPAFAQDVQLRSLDGTVELEGNLIAFDGAYYRLDTIYGPITVAAEGVQCAGPGCPDLTSFVAEARIAGEATIAEGLLPALLAGFAESQSMTLGPLAMRDGVLSYELTRRDGSPAARFTIMPGTSDSGLLALLNGDTDLALSLREPTQAERRAARAEAPDDPPLGRRVRVIALDALVPIVAPQNPLDQISLPELAQVFSGEIDNWQALGGEDAPITLHLRDQGLGLAQSFADRVLLPSALGPATDIVRHSSALTLSGAVARDAYAIGITAQSARGTTRSLALGGACGFSQTASVNAVKAEDYPLTAPVYFYLAPRRLPQLVREFLAFTETDAAEWLVAQAGFVNQSLTRTPLELQGTRIANAVVAAGDEVGLEDLQDMLARLSGAERLSATFRFGGGATDLDAQSRASAARLAAAIERGVFDGRQLIFVGFSDGEGSAAVNTRLSLRRAEVVRDAVLAAAATSPNRVTLEVEAYGEVMPMACDDTEWGRAVNRRVEVWLD